MYDEVIIWALRKKSERRKFERRKYDVKKPDSKMSDVGIRPNPQKVRIFKININLCYPPISKSGKLRWLTFTRKLRISLSFEMFPERER